MGRYDPLRDYLMQCMSDEVTLSFADVESIIGRPLPPSASRYDAWWANAGDSPFQHSQAKAWHAAGYLAQADPANQSVRFCRMRECVDPPAALPLVDWDGSGRISPAEIGISLAVAAAEEEPEYAAGERIALISCSKLKKPYRCRASELYSASTLFSLSYQYAKENADRVYILSAKYGLVREDAVIEPYNETLNDKTPAERQAWAQRVRNQLEQVCDLRSDAFMILAGKHYYEYLLPYLGHAALPLGKLPMGKRIEFLQRNLAVPAEPTAGQTAADRLHRLFSSLPLYDWRTIDAIPFENGIYIVFEKGETWKGRNRIVRVGTHTSPGRLKQRLKDHFVRENHIGSIFRKNIGKAMLNRDRDAYLPIWTLDTSKPPHIGKANWDKEAEIERRVSAYMREAFTFCVFRVEDTTERLRLEEAIIATLSQEEGFKASSGWLGNFSPEREIRRSGMWLKQGLDAKPLTESEMRRLMQLTVQPRTGRTAPEAAERLTEPVLSPRPGDRVRHRAFGDGTVLSAQPMAGDTLLEVAFDRVGRKRLMLRAASANMKKLDN